MSLRIVAVLALAPAACGGAATTAPSATPSATATSTATATAATAATASSWTVTNASSATVRVREQLVGVNFPSDAVLTLKGATGSFGLNPDGTFAAASQITFDVSTIASDESNRDNFIKQDTLEVRQFPTATLVPTKTTGLTLPLAASGTFNFTLTGKMTLHGTTKEVTFDVTAKRDGATLTATASANPAWKFADFGMHAPSVPFRVVSVVDEIRLAVDIVATLPTT